MKKYRLFLTIILLTMFIFTLSSCSSGDLSNSDGKSSIGGSGESLPPATSEGDYILPSSPSSYTNSSSPKLDLEDSTDDVSDNKSQISPNQLTASTFRDQYKFDYWVSLFTSSQNTDAVFKTYRESLASYITNVYSTNMLEVLVEGNAVIPNASVKVMKNQKVVFESLTNNSGIAYVFYPDSIELPIDLFVSYGNYQKNITVEEIPEQRKIVCKFDELVANEKVNTIDLMFVIDATGSMADEMFYLQAEMADVIQKVSNDENVVINLGLLFYRDIGDEYVTRKFDFSTNISEQCYNLSKQVALAGGDIPEAVDTALDEALKMNWSSNATTKILVHVLDAPPHKTKLNLQLFNNSLLEASKKGIRIIPVSCSGLDKWTEYLLRTEALLTGGAYVYLTNDSGLGNSHIEATTDKVVVEYFNELLIRLIKEIYTGEDIEPKPYNQSIPAPGGKEETFVVTFNSNGGSDVNPQLVSNNKVVTKPTDPIKANYTFLFWMHDGSEYDFSTPVTASITLSAVWKLSE